MKPVPPTPTVRRRTRLVSRPPLLRNVALGALYEVFLVSAVVSLLLVRAGLALSGFPQLGGRGLHIAHMLWGGMFMLASLLVLLGFVGRAAQFGAAFLSGVGFGTFIDEIGKFLTSDNNYFFRPAVALIYVIFVLLFMAGRALERLTGFTDRELLANAFDLARESHLHHRRAAHNAQVLASLQRRQPGDPLVDALLRTLETAEDEPPLVPAPLRRLQSWADRWYLALIRSRLLNRAVLVLVGLYGVFIAGSLTLPVVSAWSKLVSGQLEELVDPAGIAGGGALVGHVLTGTMLLIGVVMLWRSRQVAYRWFERAVLVNLLLAQVFTFYLQQFGALAGLAIDLVLLLVLGGLMRTERRAARLAAGSARPVN